MNTPTITSLYFREGNSDKEYHLAVEPSGEGYIVTCAYGRRGSNLTTGTKTPHIVTLAQANALHDKLVRQKTAKGYHATGATKAPYQQSGNEGTDTGIRCQLLNAIEHTELARLLTGRSHCLQQKHDGRRLMVRKQGDIIIGINRRGLTVAIPDPIRKAIEHIPYDVLIDGEFVGETLHAFDLLEVKGNDLRQRRYIDRHAGLLMVVPPNLPALRWVSTAIDPNDKLESFEELKETGGEGVVFKDVDAPYSPGRPNSGDGDKLVPAGNVTIPPNHAIPQMGTVVDVRFLYAFRESGSIYQPVYLGPRDDIPAADCIVDQLKFKPEPATTAAAA